MRVLIQQNGSYKQCFADMKHRHGANSFFQVIISRSPNILNMNLKMCNIFRNSIYLSI